MVPARRDRKSLELYLEGFDHTIALLQTRDAIERVAAECAEDLAADGVVYAEVRYAPELSTERGLTLDEVGDGDPRRLPRSESVARGRRAGQPIAMKLLVTAMRQAARSVEVAELRRPLARRGRRRLRHRRARGGLSRRPATSTPST